VEAEVAVEVAPCQKDASAFTDNLYSQRKKSTEV